jgi:hypothetical protein
MPSIEFLAFIVVGALIAFIGFRVVRDAANEPFMAALIERFRAADESTLDIDLRRRFFGWLQAGASVARISGTSKLAVGDDSLLITQLPVVNKLIPTIKIPLESLSKVDTRFFWSAMSRFDVFEIEGISDGRLLLPVGLVGTVRKNKDEHSPAT